MLKTAVFNVNLVTSKMKLQVAVSQDGSVLVVTTPGARLDSPTPGLGANVVQWPLVAPSGLRLTSDQGTPAHEYVRACAA